MILNILIICFSVVYIINHSGIMFDLSKFIYELTHKQKWNYQMIGKPLGCAQCMSFWFILIYCLFNSLTIILSVGIACLMALMSVLMDKLIGLTIKIINQIKI